MMKPFALKVLNDSLKQVGSRGDCQELAELVLNYWLAREADSEDIVLDFLSTNILAMLIDHEIEIHPANPSFVNILNLVETGEIPPTLSDRADWKEYVAEVSEHVRIFVFRLLQSSILLPFGIVDVTAVSHRKRQKAS